jgi:elongation factor 3
LPSAHNPPFLPSSSLSTMPAVTAAPSASTMSSKENKGSVKVLDELMAQLNISKEQDQINTATHNLAVFINGDIETNDAPTK